MAFQGQSYMVSRLNLDGPQSQWCRT